MNRLTTLALLLAAASQAVSAGGGTPLAPPRPILASAELDRTATALAIARAAKPSLGLRSSDDLAVVSTFTDPLGQTHVRLQHTRAGLEVAGSQLIVHLTAQGAPLPFTSSLTPIPEGTAYTEARISPAEASRAAANSFGVTSLAWSSEPVLEITRQENGIKIRTRQLPGIDGEVYDRAFSLAAFRGGEATHALTYRLQATFVTEDGESRTGEVFVDARTGQVLDKVAIQRDPADLLDLTAPAAEPLPFRPVQEFPAAAGVLNGNSQYSGQVSLQTSLNATTGLHELWDGSRGTVANPKRPGVLGIQTLNANAAGYSVNPTVTSTAYFTSSNDIWGDGLPYDWANLSAATTNTPSGQTPAVDVHHGMTVTWDLYQNIFGRNGLDNLGTSWVALLHTTQSGKAYGSTSLWSSNLGGLIVPDTFKINTTNIFAAPTSRDLVGLELGKGLIAKTANFIYASDQEALNIGTAYGAILGKLTEFYGLGGSTGTALPDFGSLPAGPGRTWLVGDRQGHTNLRYVHNLQKPSHGLLVGSPQYDAYPTANASATMLAGPAMRCFYFLAQGATPTKGDPGHSAWLPGGMSGVGLTKAAQIFYRTLAARVTNAATYAQFREAAILSAQDLFGAGGVEERAVMNAFAAVGVGLADGMPPEQKVALTITNVQDQPLMHDPAIGASVKSAYLVAPAGSYFQLRHTISGLTDTSVTWSRLGGPHISVASDGLVSVSFRGAWDVTVPLPAALAVSNEEPDLWQYQIVFPLNMDINADSVVDGEDLGLFAATYGILRSDGRRYNPACAIGGSHSMTEGTSPFEAYLMLETLPTARFKTE